MAHGVAEQLGAPLQRAHVGLGIGVEQQLVVVEAVALLGLVGTVHAQAVARAGLKAGHEAMPDLVGVLGQGDAADLRGAGLVEDADVDPRGMRREHGEVDAVAVEAGAERVRGAFQHRQGGRNVRGVGHGVWVIGLGGCGKGRQSLRFPRAHLRQHLAQPRVGGAPVIRSPGRWWKRTAIKRMRHSTENSLRNTSRRAKKSLSAPGFAADCGPVDPRDLVVVAVGVDSRGVSQDPFKSRIVSFRCIFFGIIE
jgi:hypothetical protein